MTVRKVETNEKFVGLAADSKPSAAVGSEFYEIDTRKTYICYDGTNWNETNNMWAEYYWNSFLSEMR